MNFNSSNKNFVLCILICASIFWGGPGPGYEKVFGQNTQNIKMKPVYLYFSDHKNRFLMSEKITIEDPGTSAGLGKNIINALIKGPLKDLVRTVPKQTKLRAFYTAGDCAYVDFADNITEYHPQGVKSEILSIFSIVNSLILNIEEIKRVKILIGGLKSETFSGHIDLSSPFESELLLVR